MKVIARVRGVETEHVIAPEVSVLVHDPLIKVSAPEAYEINSDKTIACMKEMSQRSWVHISTGPLFRYFFDKLFHGEDVFIPETIEEFLEEDRGVIHAAGLIVMLVEARFNSVPQVFIRTPEDFLHPRVQYYLMTVIMEIGKIPMGGSTPTMEVFTE